MVAIHRGKKNAGLGPNLEYHTLISHPQSVNMNIREENQKLDIDF